MILCFLVVREDRAGEDRAAEADENRDGSCHEATCGGVVNRRRSRVVPDRKRPWSRNRLDDLSHPDKKCLRRDSLSEDEQNCIRGQERAENYRRVWAHPRDEAVRQRRAWGGRRAPARGRALLTFVSVLEKRRPGRMGGARDKQPEGCRIAGDQGRNSGHAHDCVEKAPSPREGCRVVGVREYEAGEMADIQTRQSAVGVRWELEVDRRSTEVGRLHATGIARRIASPWQKEMARRASTISTWRNCCCQDRASPLSRWRGALGREERRAGAQW